jgi:hypothetical protein
MPLQMFRVERMKTRGIITAATFAAYLKCPTKALLLARGEKPADTFFADITANISKAYKANLRITLSINFCELASHSHAETTATFVDSESAFYAPDVAAAIEGGRRAKRPKPCNDYVPVLGTSRRSLTSSLFPLPPWQSGRRPEPKYHQMEKLFWR